MTEPSPSANPEKEKRLNAMIADYLKRKDAGQKVNKDAMLKAYPDLADGLRSYFQGEAMIGENSPALAATKLSPIPLASDVRETLKPGAAQADTASEFGNRKFGRYQILRPLGEGAMGSVYLALDTTLDRQVALKVPKTAGTANAEFMARFTREAKAAAALKHANICSVYDAGEHEGTAYITMDFIDGVPLSRFIGTEKLKSVDGILQMISIIADAVGHAHSKGVIHRDLKPGNILIDADFKPHVTDFGLARRAGGPADESRITQEGLLIGTPAYMAPEQVRGEQSKVGPQSDIYSLGVILFELLTCRLPFEGKVPEMLAKVLRDAPPVPSRIRKDLTEDVDDLCLKMLQKNPERRFASIPEVMSKIEALRNKIRETSAPSSQATAQQNSPFEIQKAHIELMLKNGQYASAIQDLEKLAQETLPGAKAAAAWAKTKLPTVKKEARSLSDSGLEALLKTAQQMFQKSDYVGCAQLIEEIPSLRRTEPMDDLLDKSKQREAEADQLLLDIKDKERREDIDGIEPLVKKLLKLKPGNAYAKRLSEALQSYSKTPATRRKYRYEKGRLQPMPEPGFLRQWAVLGSLVGMLVFLSVYSYAIFYLKSGNQILAVHVDDEWLASQGGEVTLVVDGDNHTISTPSTGGNPIAVTVTLGPHTFSVKHGDTIVHDPRQFMIEKDGRRVLSITATDVRLENHVPAHSPAVEAMAAEALIAENVAKELKPSNTEIVKTPESSSSKVSKQEESTEPKPEPTGFSEVHGVTKEQLVVWADKLPDELCPSWISVRANSVEPLFDAVATKRTEPGEWELQFFDTQNADDNTLFGTQRQIRHIVAQIPYNTPGGSERMVVWSAGEHTEWWNGPQDFIEEKIRQELSYDREVGGSKERWLPSGLIANGGHYELLATWMPYSDCQAELNLSYEELLAKIDAYRTKGWRPHIVNAVNYTDSPRYFAIFLENPQNDNWEFSPRLTVDEYTTLLASVASKGGQPRCIFSREENGTPIYSAVWDYPLDPLDPKRQASRHAPAFAVAPFNADQASQDQKAWAAYLGETVEYENSIGMKLRLIPPGKFMMGSPPDQAEYSFEGPQHRVIISQPYYMGAHEITIEQFRTFVEETKYVTESERDGKGYGFDEKGKHNERPEYSWRHIGFDQIDTYPVVNVTWNDAVAFCKWMSEKEGRLYTLPTEAQWEFACRAGTATVYQSGDDPNDVRLVGNTAKGFRTELFPITDRVNPTDGHFLVASVGQFRANQFGLYDMHGNVWEWCSDWFDPDYYQALDTNDPEGPGFGTKRSCRSGSWSYGAFFSRSALRYGSVPTVRSAEMGFRVVLKVGDPILDDSNTSALMKRSPVADPNASLKNISQVHGATAEELVVWAKGLPAIGCRPYWISVRGDTKPILYDALASRTPDQSEWIMQFYDHADETNWAEMKKLYRPDLLNVYAKDNSYERLVLWIKDSPQWEYWLGSAGLIEEKLNKGLESDQGQEANRERWLPTSISGHWVDGSPNYEMLMRWLPYHQCEWELDLPLDELPALVEKYRTKGWQPANLNIINGSVPARCSAVFGDNPEKRKWTFSPALSVNEYRSMLTRVDELGGQPQCVFSQVENGNVVYSVLWHGVEL